MEADTAAAEEKLPEAAPPAEPEPIQAEEQPAPIVDQDRGRRKALTLFDRVRQIPQADWGTRAFIYVYCLEPICDLKMGGEKKYLVKSKQPIYDEDAIMMDYGSGKYRLQLVYRKPAADKSDQIDACEIEIYNPKYPPKIPQSVWMNDPRNARWLALIPKEQPPKPDTPMGSITETFKVFSDMRKDVREELKPATDAIAKVDPVASALSMAKDLLQMRADNPMVDVMKEELKAMREEIAAERAENRKLQAEMRAPVAGAEKTDPIDSLLKAADKLEPLFSKFMPKVVDAGKEIVRGRRPGLGEVLMEQGLPILGDILKPWSNVLAARFLQAQNQPANGYASNIAPQQPSPPSGQAALASPVAPQATPPRLLQFLAQPLVMGALQSHFVQFQKEPQGEAGLDFAYWIFTSGAGEQPLIDARALGTTQILAMFKASPAWPQMQPYEAKLTQFLDQVLSWRKEQEQTGEPVPPDDDDEETDLTATM